jgi:hypothetical protein
MEEGRAWGYRVAQDAALAGASGQVSGVSNWVVFQPTVDPAKPTATPGGSTCIDPVLIKLDESAAYSAAEDMLKAEMTARGFHYTGDFITGDYLYEIKVLPDAAGGTIPNWPPRQVRLGAGRGQWSATAPAVGVYISFRVSTFLMSIVGQSTIEVHVFAAAGVAEPAQCPP